MTNETKFYYEALSSEQCVCEAWKKKRYSFCYSCYHALPLDMRNDLWQKMGEGYQEAYDAAISWLKEEGRIE
ncbi:MAG: hypothetical protein ACXABY_11880 [Candidatus Thorarchaeota archaeon]|jgi:hypothetical protein